MQYQWLRFSKMEGIKKDPKFSFMERHAGSVHARSAVKFADHIFGTKARSMRFSPTLTRSSMRRSLLFMASPGLRVRRDDGQCQCGATRRMLTQAGLLAAFGHETLESPVLRGVFVLNQILCQRRHRRPANVNNSPPVATQGSTTTTRQRFQNHARTGTVRELSQDH